MAKGTKDLVMTPQEAWRNESTLMQNQIIPQIKLTNDNYNNSKESLLHEVIDDQF